MSITFFAVYFIIWSAVAVILLTVDYSGENNNNEEL